MEKLVYAWRLDASTVGDVRSGRKILTELPTHTGSCAMDAAYDAYDVYEQVEANGADPIIKPRKNARTQTRDARGRALRHRLRHPTRWQRAYDRRPIVESVNYAVKRRWGDRLHRHGLRRQRKETGLRILTYNSNMVNRAWIRQGRQGITGREL